MRVKTVMAMLIAVNVLWAAAFFGYVHRSTTPLVKQLADSPASLPKNTPAAIQPSNAAAAILKHSTNELAAATPSNATTHVVKSLPSADKKFGWRDITNEIYLDYIANLRASGCP